MHCWPAAERPHGSCTARQRFLCRGEELASTHSSAWAHCLHVCDPTAPWTAVPAATTVPLLRSQRNARFPAILPVDCIVQYKENCALVIIDWFIRQGYITPDMPGYLELLRGLRSGDCS